MAGPSAGASPRSCAAWTSGQKACKRLRRPSRAGLAAEGMAVLLISSDVEEIIGLAHRVLVMRAGRIVAELAGDDITEAAILGAAFGSAEKGAP